MAGAPATPDFDSYPVAATIAAAEAEEDGKLLRVAWSDGRVSRYHAIWLRDNATDEVNLNPETREQWCDITAIPADIRIATAAISTRGDLELRWRSGKVSSRYHPGWLYAHDYSSGHAREPEEHLVLWEAATLGEPPTVEGAAILEDDEALESWLSAVRSHGLARLRNVDAVDGMVARVAERIGPVRTSNFGRIFDVRVQAGPGSNAYSNVALTPHTDLPTREYEPGLQLLHCLRTTCNGGRAIMVDGFRLAEAIAENDPQAYSALTRIVWPFANRAVVTDYRWSAPVIRLDAAGRVVELRVAPFLRAPLKVPFDEVEEAYRSLRVFFEHANDPAYQLRFAYAPGDLICMDNRRLLHGREAYEPGVNDRWLQGCYSEREELQSRLRILARQRRAKGVASA